MKYVVRNYLLYDLLYHENVADKHLSWKVFLKRRYSNVYDN